jgi:hypothetical protein
MRQARWTKVFAPLLLAAIVSPSFAAEPATIMGPVSVFHYKALKGNIGGDIVEPYLRDAKINYFMNALIDSVLQSEGDKFCLPSAWLSLPTGRVYFMLVPEVDTAVKEAPPLDYLRQAVVSHLATKLPCKKA